MILKKLSKVRVLVFLVLVVLPVSILWLIGLSFSSMSNAKPLDAFIFLVFSPLLALFVARVFSGYLKEKFGGVVEEGELEVLITILAMSFLSLVGNATALILFFERSSFIWGSVVLVLTLIAGLFLTLRPH